MTHFGKIHRTLNHKIWNNAMEDRALMPKREKTIVR